MSDGNPAKNAWAAAIELLREENALSNSQLAFVTMAQPLASVDDVFMIAVGSPFVKDKIEDHVAELMTEAATIPRIPQWKTRTKSEASARFRVATTTEL